MKFSFIILTILTFNLFAQVPNLSGNWSGTTNTPLGVYHVYEKYEQNGLLLSGIGKVVNTKKTDSASYRLKGSLDGNDVIIQNIEFIYKTGIQCLSKTKLEYTMVDGQEFLEGRWGSNSFVKGGCLPGISGSVKMMKVKGLEVDEEERGFKQSGNSSSTAQISDHDYLGNALADRLNSAQFHALFIGIEDYDREGVTPLDHPINDAHNLLSVLQAKYHFKDENTIFLRNPDRSAIIDSFDKLTKNVKVEDQVLIFYAGHGIWDQNMEQGYWLPVDASLDSKANWLSNSTIRDYLRGIKSKHTLLITDACFSGGILKERAVFQNSRAMLELYKMPSRKAITSGTLSTVPDESVFVKYLISNLESNESPMISAGELFNHFKIAVINNSPNGQVPQYGVISQAGDEGGEFIFYKAD